MLKSAPTGLRILEERKPHSPTQEKRELRCPASLACSQTAEVPLGL